MKKGERCGTEIARQAFEKKSRITTTMTAGLGARHFFSSLLVWAHSHLRRAQSRVVR